MGSTEQEQDRGQEQDREPLDCGRLAAIKSILETAHDAGLIDGYPHERGYTDCGLFASTWNVMPSVCLFSVGCGYTTDELTAYLCGLMDAHRAHTGENLLRRSALGPGDLFPSMKGDAEEH